VRSTDSVQRVAASGFPLGVTCRHCLHRVLVDCRALAKKLAQPRLLSSLKFRCERCGGRAVDLDLFWSPASVKRFLRPD
jgi:DNA-directed RNA polymerase subunit RPC12/RpoP